MDRAKAERATVRALRMIEAASPKKLAKEAVELSRMMLRSGTLRVKDEQRLYKRMMSKVNKIADITGMDPSDVSDQIDTQARKLGPKTPSPGKDF